MTTTEEPFNELTPAQVERLALLSEECAEVIQIVGKILRHGKNSCHPDDKDGANPNAVLLAVEIGHVIAAKDWLIGYGDVDALTIANSTRKKTEGYRAKKYLHHQ